MLALEYLAPQRKARLWLALERRRAGLTLKHERLAGGIEMPPLEGGHGEPLVLVHGFGRDKDNFTRVAGLLVRNDRVIAPDLPGFGDARGDLSARHTVADQVERSARVCRGHRSRHLRPRRQLDGRLHRRRVAHGSPPLEDRLPQITAPTLIVWGAEDKVLSPQGAAVLHERLPHSRVVLMPGIGHVPMMEAPRAAAADHLRLRADLRPMASGADPTPATHVARHRSAGA